MKHLFYVFAYYVVKKSQPLNATRHILHQFLFRRFMPRHRMPSDQQSQPNGSLSPAQHWCMGFTRKGALTIWSYLSSRNCATFWPKSLMEKWLVFAYSKQSNRLHTQRLGHIVMVNEEFDVTDFLTYVMINSSGSLWLIIVVFSCKWQNVLPEFLNHSM